MGSYFIALKIFSTQIFPHPVMWSRNLGSFHPDGAEIWAPFIWSRNLGSFYMEQKSGLLLYGAEIWAPFAHLNFNNWDRNIIERTLTQFLKRIIGRDIHSPYLMVRGELGMRPLLRDMIRRCVLYVKNVASVNGSLANEALDLEIPPGDENNILSLVRRFTLYFQETNHFLEPKDKKEVKHQVINYYDKIWKSEIMLMSKADTFRLLKNDIRLEKYTWIVKRHHNRIALSCLRLSSHPLMIEKGRHYKPSLPRSERKCPYCKDSVEDECHFLIKCPLYDNERREVLVEANRNSKHFSVTMTEIQKFNFLLSNEDQSLLSKCGFHIQSVQTTGPLP